MKKVGVILLLSILVFAVLVATSTETYTLSYKVSASTVEAYYYVREVSIDGQRYHVDLDPTTLYAWLGNEGRRTTRYRLILESRSRFTTRTRVVGIEDRGDDLYNTEDRLLSKEDLYAKTVMVLEQSEKPPLFLSWEVLDEFKYRDSQVGLTVTLPGKTFVWSEHGSGTIAFSKQWPPERIAELCLIAKNLGCKTILLSSCNRLHEELNVTSTHGVTFIYSVYLVYKHPDGLRESHEWRTINIE